MSEEIWGGPQQSAGLEGRSLERLRTLISAFLGSELRPPIREAEKLLLARDGVAFHEGQTTLELPRHGVSIEHKKAFDPTGPWSGTIDLLIVRSAQEGGPVKRLVRKAVVRSDSSEQRLGWIGEALFYLEIAPRLALPGMHIPRLYGCSLEHDTIVLLLEYLRPDTNKPSDLERITQSARMIGKLGAAAHRDQLYSVEWIRPFSPRLPPETLFALEELVAHSIPDAGERDRIVSAIETLIGSPDVLSRIRASGYRTLAHGDMHMRNIFPLARVPGDMAVIDWGKVCEGLIGHDAVLLLLPRFIGSAEMAGAGFAEAVERIQRDVIAGALSVEPSLDPERIRLGLEIGLVFQTALLVARNVSAWTGGKGEARLQRTERLASMLRGAASVAETLLRKFSS